MDNFWQPTLAVLVPIKEPSVEMNFTGMSFPFEDVIKYLSLISWQIYKQELSISAFLQSQHKKLSQKMKAILGKHKLCLPLLEGGMDNTVLWCISICWQEQQPVEDRGKDNRSHHFEKTRICFQKDFPPHTYGVTAYPHHQRKGIFLSNSFLRANIYFTILTFILLCWSPVMPDPVLKKNRI